MRKSWDEYFMDLAFMVATRSTCPRRSVGAVLVKDKRIISTGYNGAPSSHSHCTDIGCDMVDGSCVRANHAEANAVSHIVGRSSQDSTLYTTDFPCKNCAYRIVAAGVVTVVYNRPYWKDQDLVLELFNDSGILIERYAVQEQSPTA